MGDLIDLEKIDQDFNLRCQHVKLGVIIIHFIGVPSSLIILLISIVRLIIYKKRKPFLTKLIMLIFGFEIINCISKLLQFFKYFFEDTRPYLDINEIETPRGIICQIQIVLCIISDLGCLSANLLLSIRCYEVIKNKKRRLDDKRMQNISFILISFLSLAFALGFWGFDKRMTKGSIAFKYDRRDRCTYWCWLERLSSIICYAIYNGLLIGIFVFFILIACYFSKSYKKMIEKSVVIIEEPKYSKNNNEKNNINNTEEIKEKHFITSEDKKRLKEVQIMQIKCFVYPIISIVIWTLSSIYRIIDASVMYKADTYNQEEEYKTDKDIFNGNMSLQIFIEINLIFHSFLSSFRGGLYGIAFSLFEEKDLSYHITNCIYKCCKRCFCCYNLEQLEDDEEKEGPLINTSTNSSNTETNLKEKNEASNFRKSSASDCGKNNADLNTSDYRYND